MQLPATLFPRHLSDATLRRRLGVLTPVTFYKNQCVVLPVDVARLYSRSFASDEALKASKPLGAVKLHPGPSFYSFHLSGNLENFLPSAAEVFSQAPASLHLGGFRYFSTIRVMPEHVAQCTVGRTLLAQAHARHWTMGLTTFYSA